nr:hypothetical protein [Tanacetum cinerariifolium]
MDSDVAYMIATSKVPMLKPREFVLWRMRIEQYIQMMDYALWNVIENGNSIPKTETINNVETVIPPTTAKKLQRRNEVKARILTPLLLLELFEEEDTNAMFCVGHFARECRAPMGHDNRSQDVTRKTMPIETPNSSALVSCDGPGGYDWSDQAKE